MNKAVPQVSAAMEEIPFENHGLRNHGSTGAHPFSIDKLTHELRQIDKLAYELRQIDELAHELRQPLSTIESLAYYLEITAADDAVCGHLQKIRHMVCRASRILDHAATV